MVDAAYEEVVRDTFETKPLRTVLMIDDEFPTYSDICAGQNADNEKRFKQKDLALALYQAFQKRHMICDIDNAVDDIKTDRFRKSDLIILDYHLGPGENNNERSIRILRDLSKSKHFNTVVVYTAEPDQDRVWLDIMANLVGGWTALPASLEGEAQTHWERLSDTGTMPSPSLDIVMAYARSGNYREIPGELQAVARKELLDLAVPQQSCASIIEAGIHQELVSRSGQYATEPRHRAVGNFEGEKRWIQCGNSFITILKKNAEFGDDTDPGGIMSCLRSALLAWQPNLIQILISEIQNILELEALATEDIHLRDPITQTALSYYLLEALGPIDAISEPDVKVPLMAIVDKLVDGVRRRLTTDPELLALAGKALLGELRGTGWTTETRPKPFQAASILARTGTVQRNDTFFRLNSFFSTERFRRAHLTTGTIFYHPAKNQYFVTTSPACDLVARAPSVHQNWANSIFPFTPAVAILLHVENLEVALKDAANGLHIFLEQGVDKKAFKTVCGPGHQPSYEFFLVKNEGRVREIEGAKQVFDAARLSPKITSEATSGLAVTFSTTEREWVDDVFEIVDQLKAANAIRLLQLVGQHLSRIGLDYTSLPPS